MMSFLEEKTDRLIIYGEFFREIQFGLPEYGCDSLFLLHLKTDFSPPLYHPLPEPLPPGAGNTHCSLLFLPLSPSLRVRMSSPCPPPEGEKGGGLGGGGLLPFL